MSNESVQLIYPSDEMVKNAAVSGMDAYRALCAEADADYEGFWAKRAREIITWKTRSPRFSMSPMLRSSSGLPTAS
jgi:acetyl-CoA synthetase